MQPKSRRESHGEKSIKSGKTLKILDEFKYEKMQTQRDKYTNDLKETLIRTNDKRVDQTTEGSVPKLVDDIFTDAISG